MLNLVLEVEDVINSNVFNLKISLQCQDGKISHGVDYHFGLDDVSSPNQWREAIRISQEQVIKIPVAEHTVPVTFCINKAGCFELLDIPKVSSVTVNSQQPVSIAALSNRALMQVSGEASALDYPNLHIDCEQAVYLNGTNRYRCCHISAPAVYHQGSLVIDVLKIKTPFFRNEKKAYIEIKQNADFSDGQHWENQGFIDAKASVVSVNTHRFIHHGQGIFEELHITMPKLEQDFNASFFNSGKLMVSHLTAEAGYWTIAEGGSLYTLSCHLHFSGDVDVQGQWLGKDMKLSTSSGMLLVGKQGVLLSNNRANLIFVRALIEGKLGARIWLNYAGDLEILATGEVLSKGFSFLQGLFIENGHYISASHLIANAMWFNNQVGAEVNVKNLGYIHTIGIHNAGRISGTQLQLDSEAYIKNQQNGQIVAHYLGLSSPYIENEGAAFEQERILLALVGEFSDAALKSKIFQVLSLYEVQNHADLSEENLTLLANIKALVYEYNLSNIELLETHPKLESEIIPKLVLLIDAGAQPEPQALLPIDGKAFIEQSFYTAGCSKNAGIICGHIEATLETNVFRNGGLLLSYQDITLEVAERLNNLMGAFILAYGSVSIKSQLAIVNMGQILAQSTLTLDTRQWLQNLAGGRLTAPQIHILTEKLSNAGDIKANQFALHIDKTLHQFTQGKLESIEALQILSGEVINEGIIRCCQAIQLDVKHLLENHEKGLIQSQDFLAILCGSVIKNSGELSGLEDIQLAAKEIIQDLAAAKVMSHKAIKLVAEFAIRNSGAVVGANVDLSASKTNSLIENLGNIASDHLEVSAEHFRNQKEIHAQQAHFQLMQLFENVKTGLIKVEEAIEVASGKIKNEGVIASLGKLHLEAQKVIQNAGKLSANEQITLLCLSVFKNIGTIEAARDIKITAEMILQQQLSGKIIAKEQLTLVAQFALENAGLMSGQTVDLASQQDGIRNLEGAEVIAEQLTLQAKHLANQGRVQSTQLRAKIQGLLSNAGLMTVNDLIEITADKIKNQGVVKALKTICANSRRVIKNSGQISATDQVALICANVIENAGTIESLQTVKLTAERLLQTITAGEIKSGEELELLIHFSVDNSALLAGKNVRLILSEAGSIENRETGKILANEAMVTQAKALINAGNIRATQLSLETKILLDNLATGVISAKELINIKTGCFVNSGIVQSSQKITADVAQAFDNFESGRIKAKMSIGIVCASIIKNFGQIGSMSDIVIEADTILQAVTAGRCIARDKLQLMATQAIQNAGVLSGHTVELITTQLDGWFDNLEDAKVLATDDVTINTKTTHNQGVMASQSGAIRLLEHVMLTNFASGLISAGELVEVISGDADNQGQILAKAAKLSLENSFVNSGQIMTEEGLSLHAREVLELLQSGKIQAGTALELIASQKVISAGDILAFQSLSVIAPMVEQSGNMASQGDISVEVADLILHGHIQAAKDLTLDIARQWVWGEQGHFVGGHKAKLFLHQGYVFEKAIQAPGSLALACDRDKELKFKADIRAGKDLATQGGKITVGEENGVLAELEAGNEFSNDSVCLDIEKGGIYGHHKLNNHTEAVQIIGRGIQGTMQEGTRQLEVTVGNGSYLATSGDAYFKSDSGSIYNNFSTINILGNAKFDAAKGRYHQRGGEFRVKGDVDFNTPVENEMLFETTWSPDRKTGSGVAKSRAPIFDVGGHLHAYQDFTTKGGIINAGQWTHHGNLMTTEYRSFAHWTTTQAEQHTRRRLGIVTKRWYVYVTVPHEQTYKIWNANINTGQNFTGVNPASHYVVSGMNAGKVDINFTRFYVPCSEGERALNAVPLINDISEQWVENESLYQMNPTAESMINPRVHFNLEVSNFPEQTASLGPIEASLKRKFCIQKEAELVKDALSQKTGDGNLHGVSDSIELLNALVQSGLDYQAELNVPYLTQALLKDAPRPMYVHQEEIFLGEKVRGGRLILPQNAVKTGIHVKDGSMQGVKGAGDKLHSILAIEGQMHSDNVWELYADFFKLEQPVKEVFELAKANRGYFRPKAVQQVREEGGQLSSENAIHIKSKHYEQIGSQIKSKKSHVKVKSGTALLKAARGEAIVNGSRDSTIKGVFTAARIEAKQIILKADQIEGVGVSLHADGTLKIAYKEQLTLLLQQEYYHLPIEKKKGLFQDTISGGTDVSLLENYLQGSTIILHSAQGDTHLQNVNFRGAIPTYEIDLEKLVKEALHPQGTRFSYQQMNLLGQVAVLAASYFAASYGVAALMQGANPLAIAMAKGAIASGIQAGLTDGDIVKGILQGGATAGVTHGLGGVVKGLKMHEFMEPVVNSLVQASATTALSGGDFSTRFLTNMVAEGIKDLPQFANETLQSIAPSAMVSIAKGEKVEAILQTGVLSFVQGQAEQAGKEFGEKRAKKPQVVKQPEKAVPRSERDSLVKADKALAAARKRCSFLEDDEPPIKSHDLNENSSKAPVRPRDKHNQPVLSDAERDPQKQMAQGRKAGLMFRQQHHKHHDDVGEYFSSLGRVNGWGHESSYLEAGYDVHPGFYNDSFSVKDNNHHQSSFGEKVLDFLIPAAYAHEEINSNEIEKQKIELRKEQLTNQIEDLNSRLAHAREKYGKQCADALEQAKKQNWSKGAIEQVLRGASHDVRRLESQLEGCKNKIEQLSILKQEEWIPLSGSGGDFETYSAYVEKNKKGKIQYRNEKGRYVSSPFKKVKENIKQNKCNLGVGTSFTSDILPKFEKYITKDLCETKKIKLGNAEISTGVTTYAKSGAELSLSNGVKANAEVKVGLGVLDIKKETVVGNIEGDINGPLAEAHVSVAINKKTLNLDAGLQAELSSVKAVHKFPKICLSNHCVIAKINVSKGIGVGANAHIGFGLKNNEESRTFFTAGAGGGFGHTISANIDIEHELKNKDYNEEANNNNPRKGPAL